MTTYNNIYDNFIYFFYMQVNHIKQNSPMPGINRRRMEEFLNY